MTDEMLSHCVYTELREVFEKESVKIYEQLSKIAAPGTFDLDKFNLLYTAMFLSSQCSVQYMLRYLEKAGLIQLPDNREAILRLNDNLPASSEPPAPAHQD